MGKQLYIIAPYPFGQAPSQRFRFEQYISHFEKAGYTVHFHPFLNEKSWNTLYKEGSFLKKAFGMLGSFGRRAKLMFQLKKADAILIHREASMVGPPMFEWIISKVLRKPFIYDFDDAIWLPNYSESNARFHRLKAYGKVKRIIKWAHVVSVGNEFLKDYALKYNDSVRIIPTTIDLENGHRGQTDQSKTPVIIGWTGTHTTMHYLDAIVPVIKKLELSHDFKFRVISNQAPDYQLKSLEFVPWNKASEMEDLAAIQIGVMPLTDTIWAQGKCGFKGLQYMAMKIPAVMSPVGVNTTIIDHNINGFICDNSEGWEATLNALLSDPELRKTIGEKGHQTVLERYSVQAHQSNYLKLFES